MILPLKLKYAGTLVPGTRNGIQAVTMRGASRTSGWQLRPSGVLSARDYPRIVVSCMAIRVLGTGVPVYVGGL